jgi:NADPH:quinone reductase-like Zn-dependent oxidoreductase
LDKTKTGYFGSERDGGFAEYTTMPARNALAVHSTLSDAELATFSCSYSTAEGMLTRARVTSADTVLIPGASGGVGGALVQLAKLRGARVIALASEAKHGDVAALGADVVLPRAPADLRSRARGDGSRCWPMSWVARHGPGSSTFWNAAGATPVRAQSPGRWWSWTCARFTCAT